MVIYAKIPQEKITAAQEQLAYLERISEGRLGVSALYTEDDQLLQFHANERFPMNCTSKVMVISTLLKKSMADKELLQKRIMFTKQDLVSGSPRSSKRIKQGMTLNELSEAALIGSDNTATNLVMKYLGGPQAVTAFARSIGDSTFNLKRWWPAEARWLWNDLQDTSTPAAMTGGLRRLAFGADLGPEQRKQLLTWLKNNKTGDARIREGVPFGWEVADKTGTGFYHGTTNDIGIIWPPNSYPIVVSIFYKHKQKNAPKREDIIAKATRIVRRAFGH
jgi:beta-lactamase class A